MFSHVHGYPFTCFKDPVTCFGRIKEGDEVRLKSKPDQLTTSKRFRLGWEGGGGSYSPAKLNLKQSNLSS